MNQKTTEDTPTTGWGIISTGRHPDQKIVPAMQLASGTQVVAVHSRDMVRAQTFSKKHNIDKAYDSLDGLMADPKVDAVFIASPNHLHAYHVKRAAEAGKHVLVEKPMAVSVDEAVEMIRICRKCGVKLGVGFHMRHHPKYRKFRQLIQEGNLGHISMAQADNVHLTQKREGPLCEWWYEPEKVGGGYAIMGMGVHMIDLLQFLLGQPITEVAAITDGQTAEKPLEKTGAIVLRFRNGVIGTVWFGCFVPDTWNWNGASVYGIDGRISLRGDLNETLEVKSKSMNLEEESVRNPMILYQRQIEAFNRAVQQNEEFDATGIDGLSVVQATSAALESAASGRSVKVEAIEV